MLLNLVIYHLLLLYYSVSLGATYLIFFFHFVHDMIMKRELHVQFIAIDD